eukprot:6320731-Prymnesium_polylepis.1
MNVWMYVVREFEDAIDDCSYSSLDNNYGSVHAWDEGVAFYAGSLEGSGGSATMSSSTSGKMIFALADKRCANFGTCGISGGLAAGTSQVNQMLQVEWNLAKNALMALQCESVRSRWPDSDPRVAWALHYPRVAWALRPAWSLAPPVQAISRHRHTAGQPGALSPHHASLCSCPQVRPILQRIVALMGIPIVQGTLRYAYKVGVYGPAGANTLSNSGLTEKAEGATFAAAIVPQLHNCSAAAATIVWDNMKIGAASTDHLAVKAAFEANYACMGITCAQVGGLCSGTANGKCTGYYSGYEPCTDASTSTAAVYERIAGYLPRSQVTDHNALDMDPVSYTHLTLPTICSV